MNKLTTLKSAVVPIVGTVVGVAVGAVRGAAMGTFWSAVNCI